MNNFDLYKELKRLTLNVYGLPRSDEDLGRAVLSLLEGIEKEAIEQSVRRMYEEPKQ